jgi:phage shock protein PspC (stress-responsive transcriptional regulator)
MNEKRLVRSSTNKMFAGVCAGLADYFNIDPTIVRLAFVILFLASTGVPVGLIYIVLWIVMPEAPTQITSGGEGSGLG